MQVPEAVSSYELLDLPRELLLKIASMAITSSQGAWIFRSCSRYCNYLSFHLFDMLTKTYRTRNNLWLIYEQRISFGRCRVDVFTRCTSNETVRAVLKRVHIYNRRYVKVCQNNQILFLRDELGYWAQMCPPGIQLVVVVEEVSR